jgi:DNA-binding NarL/FixJ family response regulator
MAWNLQLIAIREIAAGGTHINPAVTERVLHGIGKTSPSRYPLTPPLTERETHVLRLIANGYSNLRSAWRLQSARARLRTTSPASWQSSACAIGQGL